MRGEAHHIGEGNPVLRHAHSDVESSLDGRLVPAREAPARVSCLKLSHSIIAHLTRGTATRHKRMSKNTRRTERVWPDLGGQKGCTWRGAHHVAQHGGRPGQDGNVKRGLSLRLVKARKHSTSVRWTQKCHSSVGALVNLWTM